MEAVPILAYRFVCIHGQVALRQPLLLNDSQPPEQPG